ncbi:MAG: ferritin [Bacteroidia bacterium]|nr:ferritin [Bacteroidia bacterium]
MMKKNINQALNEQIALEAESSHIYLSMASWAEKTGYHGVAQFLYKHSDEERLHMLKLIRFVNERDGVAVIPAIKQPKETYKNLLEVFQSILEHEVYVTNEINKLVELSLKEKDFTTHHFLQWYVSEQLEEEAMAKQINDKLKLIGNDKMGIYVFDRDINSMFLDSENTDTMK